MKWVFRRSAIPIALGIFTLWPAPPVQGEEPRTVSIAAAASLRPALDEILAEGARRHQTHARATYGASGTLATQILRGAMHDLFLSADTHYPAEVASRAARRTFVFARGRLALYVRSSVHTATTPLTLAVLEDPAVRKIAVAQPAHAPYGARAIEALQHEGSYDTVRTKLVFGENVGQVAHFLESGAADAGFLPVAIAASRSFAEKGSYYILPRDIAAPVAHGGVALNEDARTQALARFIVSEESAVILGRHGYEPP